MISLIILVFFVLLASGIFSMLEAAILSMPFLRIKMLVKEGRYGSKTLLQIKEHIHKYIATIVVLNNSINIIGSIFVAHKVTVLFGDRWLGVASGCLTFLIIVLAEIIPKTIGERFRIPVSLAGAKPLKTVTFFLYPLVSIITLIPSMIVRATRIPKITEDEIKTLVRMARDSGEVELDEEVLISRVFRLNDLKASQMMTSRDRIYAVSSSRTLGELKKEIMDSPHSRIVVYGRSLDHIVGIAQQRKLLKEIANDRESERVDNFMVQPIFVREYTRADYLLERFRLYHQHLFIVQDKRKKTLGIITMEDVLEELFGEIYDEKDVGLRGVK